jgi:hypothetical protein
MTGCHLAAVFLWLAVENGPWGTHIYLKSVAFDPAQYAGNAMGVQYL